MPDDFIDAIPDAFDFAALVDTQVQSIESTVYTDPLIYKYYPPLRRDFFERLTVRLSPREALNDPFEMSERWKEISTDGLRAYMRGQMQEVLPKLFTNEKYPAKEMKKHLAESGTALTADQERALEAFFASNEGRALVMSRLPNAHALTLMGIDQVFDRLEQQIIEGIVARMGVLSLTDDPLNQQMWGLYAAAGSGFVVGFDARHPFFFGKGAGRKKLTQEGSVH
jgi:hypothetical protein